MEFGKYTFCMPTKMFSRAKIGDKIYSFTSGKFGKIKEIDKDENEFPIHLTAVLSNGQTISFNVDGVEHEKWKPTIFWDKPKFKIPKRPFDLKAEYKKLKKKEFVFGKKNFTIIFTENSSGCFWKVNYFDDIDTMGTYYYDFDDALNFIELLQENEVAPEKLKQVIKEVENGRKK